MHNYGKEKVRQLKLAGIDAVVALQRIIHGNSGFSGSFANAGALRDRSVKAPGKLRRGGVEHAVLVGDKRGQAVRDQRLGNTLVEVGAPPRSCLTGIQEDELDAALTEYLTNRPFAEQDFGAVLAFKYERAFLLVVIESTVADKVHCGKGVAA